jgi:hypothetical protein
VPVTFCNAGHRQPAAGQDDIRLERNQFPGVLAKTVEIAHGPARVDLHVATVAPTKLLQPLEESRDACR